MRNITFLHNKKSNKELKNLMLSDHNERITVSFYKYYLINNLQDFRDNLYRCLFNLQVFGRIYIANEGINAQISVPKRNFYFFKFVIYNIASELNNIRLNIALDNTENSFWVLCIKIKSRILYDGINIANFNLNKVGYYLKAKEVNNFLYDKETIFVDVRNYYEYEIGHFHNAIEIKSNTFREQLMLMVSFLYNYKNKNIILYCTGGIRCEKASAWLLFNKFKYIYQIEGGIIEYVRTARKEKLPINFIGKLFVFDNRLGERVTSDIISFCHQCGIPCDNHTNCKYDKCHLLFIQCIKCTKKYFNCCSYTCKEKIQKYIH